MNGIELMIFKDEINNQIELKDFSKNVKLQDDKILIIKYSYVSMPAKKQNILMITDKEEGDNNKLGVGRIMAIASNITTLSVGDSVIFNKWNNCLEFHHQSNVYYIVKLSEVHATLSIKITKGESK